LALTDGDEKMRMEVRTFQAPRWLAPLLGLLALVLIPIGLMAAVVFAVLALGITVIRAFIPLPRSSS
jgi:hypothetical protein